MHMQSGYVIICLVTFDTVDTLRALQKPRQQQSRESYQS